MQSVHLSLHELSKEHKAEWVVRVTAVDTCMYSMGTTLRIVPELGVVRVVCCINVQ